MKKLIDNSKTIGLLCALILLFKLIPGAPWWMFLLPVVLLGRLVKRLQWRIHFFGAGFIAGLLVWSIGNLAWDTVFRGHILSGFGPLVKTILLLAAGIMGGLLTGLAMLIGKYLAPAAETVPEKV